MTDQLVYFSVRQAANLLSISPRIIRRYTKQRHLPAYRITGQPAIRIKREDREDTEALLEPLAAEAAGEEPER